MTQGGLSSLQARGIVEARLGREPQDMLESAVALEAWAGVDAGEALAHGREMMAWAPSAPKRSAGRLPGTPEQRGIAIEALSFVIVVVAIACWAAPRTSAGVRSSSSCRRSRSSPFRRCCSAAAARSPGC